MLRKLALRGDIDDQLAEEARLAVGELRLSRHPMTDQLADRMWELRHTITSYDAAYVALAEQLEVPLVTADRSLADAARSLTSIEIEHYAGVAAPS